MEQNICLKHKTPECYNCLKDAVYELLYHTYVAGNGGFAADFGLVLFNNLARLTGYDTDKRKYSLKK